MVLDNGAPWVLEDFQAFVVEDVFAGVPEVWAIIPEGNAKSTLMGGVALYHADFTPTANCLVAASSRDQAGVLFGQAAGLIRRSPGFDRRFRIFEGYRRIVAYRTDGRVQVMAADDRTGDGAIPSLAIIDELHRLRDLALYRTWRGKLDKRGGQLLGISTAGEPGGEFENARQALHDVATETTRVGRHTRAAGPDSVIHDWRLAAGDDPDDMRVVKLANPLSTITAESLERRRRSPTMTPDHWARFVCNVPTRAGGRWLESRAGWDAGLDPAGMPADGAEIVLGIDPAWHQDTCAVVAFAASSAPDAEGEGDLPGGYAWPLGIFVPGDDEGGSVPVWRVREAVLEAARRYRVTAIGYDRNRGFEQLAQELSDDHGLPMVNVPSSGAVWAPLTAALRSAINRGAIRHPGDQRFTAHVLAGEAKASPHGVRLHGRTRGKVDALMALGIAWQIAHGKGNETPVSIYETRGLL